MKEGNKTKLKLPILTILLLFLISVTLSAANRRTTPAFGSKTITAISQTVSITKRPQQIYITFHWQLTIIRIPTIHHPQCRRHGSTIHSPQGYDGTLYDYTYTGSNLLETYADTAGRIKKYTYGHALVSQSNATGEAHSVITDYQNSVIATLTPTPMLYAYSPFGKVRYTSSEGVPQTLGWLGRQFDSETGNNYLINRYYNADRGRFLSPDRYQYVNNATPFTFNLYQYGYANPLLNVDPEGLETDLNYFTTPIQVTEGNPYGIDREEYHQLLKQGFIPNEKGLFRRFFLLNTLPDDLELEKQNIHKVGQYYVFEETVEYKEDNRTMTVAPVYFSVASVRSVDAFLGELKAGYTSNNADTTSGFTSRDGSLNPGYILGHTLGTGEKVLGVLGMQSMGNQLIHRLVEAERMETRVRVLTAIEENRSVRLARIQGGGWQRYTTRERVMGNLEASKIVRYSSYFKQSSLVSSYPVVQTPYGTAYQSLSNDALALRKSALKGQLLYRAGRLERSVIGSQGQFWGYLHPMSPDYAKMYGMPAGNTFFDFINAGVVKKGAPFVVREAPGIGINGGGTLEIVTAPSAVVLKFFSAI